MAHKAENIDELALFRHLLTLAPKENDSHHLDSCNLSNHHESLRVRHIYTQRRVERSVYRACQKVLENGIYRLGTERRKGRDVIQEIVALTQQSSEKGCQDNTCPMSQGPLVPARRGRKGNHLLERELDRTDNVLWRLGWREMRLRGRQTCSRKELYYL